METLIQSGRIKRRRNFFNFSKYDYIFFDFDGVIVDSERIKIDGFIQLYKKFGKEVVDKILEHHITGGGLSRYKKFKIYHEEFLGKDIGDNEIKRLAKRYSQIIFKKVLKAKYIKGAIEFLRMCERQKKTNFLVSSTPEKEIKNIVRLKRLDKYFKAVKGSPAIKEVNIKYLIDKYKVDTKRSVLFGDSLNDLKAANRNSISFVGINYYKPKEGFKDFKELLSEMTT